MIMSKTLKARYLIETSYEGTRKLCGVFQRPIVGTIIKPSVGLTPRQTAEQVKILIESALDFIKDDELMSDSPYWNRHSLRQSLQRWLLR